MVKNVVLYVEGGNTGHLSIECRKAFCKILEKFGLQGCMPRIKACGKRNDAYARFKQACKNEEEIPVLLIDSECAVDKSHETGVADEWKPWEHLKKRDSWEMPYNTDQSKCHLMVECMESWILVDKENLSKYYGQGFDVSALPNINDVEVMTKQEIFDILKNATKNTKTKGIYSKGKHSFELLQNTDVSLIISKSKWAKRFFDEMKTIIRSG